MDAILNNFSLQIKQPVKLADGTKIAPYLADPGLTEAVALAVQLRRPLLIKGEPGCGKTRLAQAVAYALNQPLLERKEDPIPLREVYFEWHVKSISKAREGLYHFDYIERLQDAQLKQAGDRQVRLKKEIAYVKLGPLGEAFEQTKRPDRKIVVLIDEIDKADPDFPNDLLRELDEMRYTVEEIDGQRYPKEKERAADPENRPVVIITSNDEKELPMAFLRRCLFYHIDFPGEDQLRKIVTAHFGAPETDARVQKLVEAFDKVRQKMEREKEDREKKISTSELIDWCRILLPKNENELNQLLAGELPYAAILFKNREDLRRYAQAHLDE